MKFKDFKPVGLLKITNGFAVDSIGENEDVRYMLFHDKDRRKAVSLEGITSVSKNVVQNLAKISSKTEYLIIAPEEFLAPAESLAVFRSSDKSASPLVTAVVAAENTKKLLYYKLLICCSNGLGCKLKTINVIVKASLYY